MSSLLSNAEDPAEHVSQGLLPGFGKERERQPFSPSTPRPSGRGDTPARPRLVRRKVSDLHPWPGFEDVRKPLAPQKLYVMAESGEAAFREPILVTPNGTVLDGYARWTLARQQGRETMECIEHTFPTEEDALRFFLQRHTSHSDSLTPFSRVVLAMELKELIRERARENQRTRSGSQLPSKLTQGGAINVRQEIARLAGVSAGNVTKVEQTLTSACPGLLVALHQGDVSIHRAHQWSKLSPSAQQKALLEWHGQKDIRTTIRRMVSRHKSLPIAPLTAAQFIRGLAAASDEDLGRIELHVIKHPGKRLIASEELVFSLHIETTRPINPAHRKRGQ